MAILSSFEITVLTSRIVTSKLTGLPEQQWHPLTEYYPTTFDATRTDFCKKYIGVPPPTTDPTDSVTCSPQSCGQSQSAYHTAPADVNDLTWFDPAAESETEQAVEFAIDYKVHCGFTFNDSDEADLIVFRTYLDKARIGSGFVKRNRWERSGTYRVRKKGKRVWIGDPFGAVGDGEWVQQKWTFEPGNHGTLMIEAWRETQRPQHVCQGIFQAPSDADWAPFADHWQYPDDGVIDLTGMTDDLSAIESVSKTPRVKKTRKVDLWPMATFIFEYRSEKTLKTMGIIKEPEVVVDDSNETEAKQLPLTTRSNRLPEPRHYCHDTSQIWSSTDAPATVHPSASNNGATAMTDAEFDALLNGTQEDCQESTPVKLTADTTLRAYGPFSTHPTSYAHSSVPMTRCESYSDDKMIASQASSKENDPPQVRGTEVVDLTMLD